MEQTDSRLVGRNHLPRLCDTGKALAFCPHRGRCRHSGCWQFGNCFIVRVLFPQLNCEALEDFLRCLLLNAVAPMKVCFLFFLFS